MKTRTALVLATLLVLSVSAVADEPQRAPGATARQWGGQLKFDPVYLYDRAPKLPYILDGVEYPAHTPLPDVALIWVLTQDDVLAGTVHIFSSRDGALAFKKKNREANTDGFGNRKVATNCSWTSDWTRFEKSRGCGDSGYLPMYPPDGEYDQLDSISWNNSISCVKSACNTSLDTALYSCRYFETSYVPTVCEDPDVFWVDPGVIIYDLTYYGGNFNNRTSSTRFESH